MNSGLAQIEESKQTIAQHSLSIPELHHFYHIYADGAWREPVEEHLEALETSGLAAQKNFLLNVGLVGKDENSGLVRTFLNRHCQQWNEIASSRDGWEQV